MASRTVLIVDDDFGCSELLRALFEELGYTAVVTYRARQVPSMLDQHSPVLMVLDLMLPDGNGLDVLQRVRNSPQFASLPVVLCTAALFEMREMRPPLDDAYTTVITKPFHIDAISDAVMNLLTAP